MCACAHAFDCLLALHVENIAEQQHDLQMHHVGRASTRIWGGGAAPAHAHVFTPATSQALPSTTPTAETVRGEKMTVYSCTTLNLIK